MGKSFLKKEESDLQKGLATLQAALFMTVGDEATQKFVEDFPGYAQPQERETASRRHDSTTQPS